ncbi:DciA family protein [Demequina subtropica]|uniref:DciA family protein n=1 Tax=Demequina subtropica TaxID=1638989 RepID=UPI0007834F79|nr:DciA family protein [Demequina subtropica]
MSDAPQDDAVGEPPAVSPGEKDEHGQAEPLVPADAARLAREALERARASARMRGATRTTPRQGRKQREQARRDTVPYGTGRDPASMSDAVAALLRRMGWTEQIEVSSVTARWREVIGDRIADNCEPLGFDEGVLTVKATSTAWATQLQIMSGQIRHRINEEFGREIVTELKVLGPTARSWTKGPRSVKGRGPRDTYG